MRNRGGTISLWQYIYTSLILAICGSIQWCEISTFFSRTVLSFLAVWPFDSLWLFYIKMITRLVGVCVCVSDKVVLS